MHGMSASICVVFSPLYCLNHFIFYVIKTIKNGKGCALASSLHSAACL